MVAYNPPLSQSVVELPEELVERYEAAGWTPVKKQAKSAERKPAAKK